MKKIALFLGIFLGILNSVIYFTNGFNFFLLIFLFSSLLLITFSFSSKQDFDLFKKITKKDFVFLVIILVIFIPLYFWQIYQLPRQINSDEVTIMASIKNVLTRPNLDYYGLSDYFGFPSLVFAIFGLFANLLGGVNLLNSRSVHAGSGILIILFTFLFMHLFFPRVIAFLATVVIGSSHSLIAISRMAMRDNSGLLVETIAFIFLFLALRKKSLLLSFVGGTVSALGFYTYFPGRIIFIIWTVFLINLAIFYRQKYPLKDLFKLYFCSLLGFLILTFPILIATYKAPVQGLKFAKEQLLLYPEGRALQLEWVSAPTISQGIRTNIEWGLTVFNNSIVDHGWIYPNFNHGFVDPATGILLWVGVVFALFKIKKREENLFFLVGLGILLFTFAFIVNKAPDYTRLLVTLPFVGYFVITGLFEIGYILRKTFRLKYLQLILTLSGVIVIFFWNLSIFNDFIQKGLRQGDDLGNTGRYIDVRRNLSGYNYYIVASSERPYFNSSDANGWHFWTSFFSGSNQVISVVDPNSLSRTILQKPFTIFTSQAVFELNKDFFASHFPEIKTTNIKNGGSLVALEER